MPAPQDPRPADRLQVGLLEHPLSAADVPAAPFHAEPYAAVLRAGEPFERPRFPSERPRGSGGLQQPVVFTPPHHEHDWVLRVTAGQETDPAGGA